MSGRLIRKRAYCGDAGAVSYIVAVSDSTEAVALINGKVGSPGDDIEDLGRVSGPLVRALQLRDGDFVALDASELSLAPADGD